VAATRTADAAVLALYGRLIDGWNDRDGDAFAAPFAPWGTVIGFDGSEQNGREAIAAAMRQIFEDHETAGYVAVVKHVGSLGPAASMLRASAGMIPPGSSHLDPSLNARQTVIATQRDGRWEIVLFQNTAAQFHGRPDLAERFTDELLGVLQRT
jgi:uncharacterized protein (TIGR02246 family)